MRVSVLALAAAGCGFRSASTTAIADDGGVQGPDAADIDARPIDSAALDGKQQAVCIGTYVTVCVDPPNSTPTFMTGVLDTDTSPLCVPYTSPQGVDACVITGTSITVPGGIGVSVAGKRRLILASTSSITIAGTLDAASHVANKHIGPAGDSGPCSTNYTDPTFGLQGGGGWGGSFGAPGGNGGNGAHAGQGGIAAAAPGAASLRGGCPGSAGGGISGYAGAKGHGGGGVALLAMSSISISGNLDASGGGGGGGHGSGGGGGGGSGGMVVLDAPDSIGVSGHVWANGGAGGEGASSSNDGTNGGESAGPNMAGTCADTVGTGGNGGPGSAGGVATGGNAQSGSGLTGGGGGAGGGAGVIKVVTPGSTSGTTDLAHTAPPPS